MTAIAMRLHPTQDVVKMLERFAREKGIDAAAIMTATGDVDRVRIELPDGRQLLLRGPHALCSLSGVFGTRGHNLHAVVGDGEGVARAGRLVGAKVLSSVEVIVRTFPSLVFKWEAEPVTGKDALLIESRAS